MTELGVFTEAELNSRYHVRLERYIKNMEIEVQTLRSMVDTLVVPAAIRFQSELAESVVRAKAAGVDTPQKDLLARVTTQIQGLGQARFELDKAYGRAEDAGSEEKKAHVFAAEVAQAMEGLRRVCDQVESTVADGLWPLPKYREMLFSS
jgi:glutamine synthetase